MWPCTWIPAWNDPRRKGCEDLFFRYIFQKRLGVDEAGVQAVQTVKRRITVPAVGQMFGEQSDYGHRVPVHLFDDIRGDPAQAALTPRTSSTRKY
jgi:hypothetical protein